MAGIEWPGIKVERTKTYPPCEAGRRVGWVSIAPFEPEIGDGVRSIQVVTATVGSEGAHFDVGIDAEGGDRVYSRDMVRGLSAVAALAYTVLPGEKPDMNNPFYYRTTAMPTCYGRSDPRELMQTGADRMPTIDTMRWGDSPAELLAIIKQLMQEQGIPEEYARFYSNYNLRLAHAQYTPEGLVRHNDVPSILLSDPAMHNATGLEYDKAIELVHYLKSSEGIIEGITGAQSRGWIQHTDSVLDRANTDVDRVTHGLASQMAAPHLFYNGPESTYGKFIGNRLVHADMGVSALKMLYRAEER